VKRIVLSVVALSLFSCGQERVVYKPVPLPEMARELSAKGIDPCRVLPCSFSGKTAVEVVNVPAQDRGDFVIYPHKEAVILKPIDALPPEQKAEEGKCRR